MSDSEIHKIETGNQECRLSSFIRVCAALGIPGGLVLDQVVSSSMAYFSRRVQDDPGLEAFIAERWKLNSFGKRAVTDQIACLCSVAAHLLRCSDATRKAKSFQYPGPQVEKAFLDFARTVDNTSEGLERVSILSALERTPIAELARHNLLCPDLLNQIVKKAARTLVPKSIVQGMITEDGVPMWWPLPAPQTPFTKQPPYRRERPSGERPEPARYFATESVPPSKPPLDLIKSLQRHIDRGEVEPPTKVVALYASPRNVRIMPETEIGSWDELLDQLKQETAAPGAKADFARSFGVSIQVLSQWLSGASAPKADTALRLRKRLREAVESKQKKRAGSAETRPALKTRKSKSTSHEKAKSDRK